MLEIVDKLVLKNNRKTNSNIARLDHYSVDRSHKAT